MKAHFVKSTERTGISIRADIKQAMEVLRIRRCQNEGCYVSLGKLFGEAALMLLEMEGVPVSATLPVKMPVKRPAAKALPPRTRPAAVRA